ncbi:hypothetical protein HK096_008348, partial [Nowakowskiella sp. JEL0078]
MGNKVPKTSYKSSELEEKPDIKNNVKYSDITVHHFRVPTDSNSEPQHSSNSIYTPSVISYDSEMSRFPILSKVNVTVNPDIALNWQPTQYHSLRTDLRIDGKRGYHAVIESPYTLPADLREKDRLNLQHLLHLHCFGRLFHPPLEGLLSDGAKVLDVGCGPGAWMFDVANLYPNSEFVGVDIAISLFENFHPLPNMKFTFGNVLEKLPFPDNTFDFVYQRLLGLAIPYDNWDNVIRELVRVAKPNGFIEIVELGE